MAAAAGKVALLNSTTPATGACPLAGTTADLVGYGATANCIEGAGPTPAPSNTPPRFANEAGAWIPTTTISTFRSGLRSRGTAPRRSEAAATRPPPSTRFRAAGPPRRCSVVDVETTGIVTGAQDERILPPDPERRGQRSGDIAGAVRLHRLGARGDLWRPVLARGTAGEFFGLTQLESSLPGDVTVNRAATPAGGGRADDDHPRPGRTARSARALRRHAHARRHPWSRSRRPTSSARSSTVLPGVARPMREPGIEISLPVPPDPTSGVADCCIPRWDENPERIMIDSDGLAGAAVLSVTSHVTLHRCHGPARLLLWRLQGAAGNAAGHLRATSAPSRCRCRPLDEFTVAGFNIENFANDETQRQKGRPRHPAGAALSRRASATSRSSTWRSCRRWRRRSTPTRWLPAIPIPRTRRASSRPRRAPRRMSASW